MKQHSLFKRYGYLWVTLILFLCSILGHWLFAWFAFVNEQTAHAQEILLSEYFTTVIRDTLENWQSEFLQLIWQVAGLSFLWYIGSPQSKDGTDRAEEKIDQILKAAYGAKEADAILARLDAKYPRA